MADPKRIVAEGYDRIAERYAAWTGDAWAGPRARYGSLLWQRLPEGARVLELGCGIGLPATRELARRFAVTGVDNSARSIALARHNVPDATFLHGDMASLALPAASFDAVVAFYSIIHVPRQEHPRLLRDIAAWLRPGGLLIATMGAGATEDGYEQDWHGAPMYWSHFDSATNRDLVSQAGLRLLEATELIDDEDGVPVTFLWIVAQKPQCSAAHRPEWAKRDK
jgi:SAM-dependent methyltransferase